MGERSTTDRKSTRLNSSHANISYAVFCLKKKKTKKALRDGIERHDTGVQGFRLTLDRAVSPPSRRSLDISFPTVYTFFFFFFFFFNDPATPEIYPLSLHDALPISDAGAPRTGPSWRTVRGWDRPGNGVAAEP